jgi:hypothetical protein
VELSYHRDGGVDDEADEGEEEAEAMKGKRRRVRSEAKARMRSMTAPETLGATV